MLVGPPSAKKFWPRLHQPTRTANFKCYLQPFQQFYTSKNYPKCSVLIIFLHLGGQLGSQESTNEKSANIHMLTQLEKRHLELLFEKNYGPASATQPKIFGPKVILPTTPSILKTIFSSFGPFLIFNSQLKVSQKQDYHKSLFSNWECKKVVKTEHFG